MNSLFCYTNFGFRFSKHLKTRAKWLTYKSVPSRNRRALRAASPYKALQSKRRQEKEKTRKQENKKQ
jgi:hypothetical protein